MCVNISEYRNKYACVAQLVVQLIRNEQVAGSSPVTSSTLNRIVKPFGLQCGFSVFRDFSFLCAICAPLQKKCAHFIIFHVMKRALIFMRVFPVKALPGCRLPQRPPAPQGAGIGWLS